MTLDRGPDAICTQALVPFETTVALDVVGLPAGTCWVIAGDQCKSFTLDVANEPPTDVES